MDINLLFEWVFFFIVKIEMGYCIYMCCICVIFKLKKKIKYVLFYLVFFLDKVGIMLMDWVGVYG